MSKCLTRNQTATLFSLNADSTSTTTMTLQPMKSCRNSSCDYKRSIQIGRTWLIQCALSKWRVFFVSQHLSKPKLKRAGIARDFTSKIQQLRKKAGLNIEDEVIIFYNLQDENCELKKCNRIRNQVNQANYKKPLLPFSYIHSGLLEYKNAKEKGINIDVGVFYLVICHYSFLLNN